MVKILLANAQSGITLDKADYRIIPAQGGAAIHLARYGQSWDDDPVKYAIIRRAFTELERSGALGQIDQFCAMALDENDSLLGWIAAGPASINQGMTFGTLGFEGDGASAYIDTGFNPSTAGGKFSLNGAHFGVYVSDNAGAENLSNVAFGQVSGSNRAVLYPKSLAGGSTAYRLNSGMTQSFINPKFGQPGSMLVNRGGANTTRMLHDEDVVHSTNGNPATEGNLPNGNLAVGRLTTSYGGGKYAAWSFGGGLSVSLGRESAVAKALTMLGRGMTA